MRTGFSGNYYIEREVRENQIERDFGGAPAIEKNGKKEEVFTIHGDDLVVRMSFLSKPRLLVDFIWDLSRIFSSSMYVKIAIVCMNRGRLMLLYQRLGASMNLK